MILVEEVLRSGAATERLGARVARAVRPPLVLLLDGDLGAGKTTFSRGFVRALAGGAQVIVQSPTFALARSYPTNPPVHHLDLYRLEDGSGLAELGLLDLLEDERAFSLVEWPRNLALPALRVGRVKLETAGKGRRVRLEVPEEAVVDRNALDATQR